VRGEEIERFFHSERNIILLQFFAGKMTGHENLWMGLKLQVNTFNELAVFSPLASGGTPAISRFAKSGRIL
jgi:hypothetical protein